MTIADDTLLMLYVDPDGRANSPTVYEKVLVKPLIKFRMTVAIEAEPLRARRT